MQPSVRETSIAAYHELRDDGKLTAKQQQIIDYLHRHPGAVFSRLEISRAIDMPTSGRAGFPAAVSTPFGSRKGGCCD